MKQLNLPLFDDLQRECDQLRLELAEARRVVYEKSDPTCRCDQLRQELAETRAELSRVQKLLSEKEASAGPVPELARIIHQSEVRETPETHYKISIASEEDRVQLFRSLFKGRDDVYAIRWDSKGKSGYSPKREHDWDSHTVNPKTGKWLCGATCRLLPLTDSVIRNHLFGDDVVGVYPLLSDESCWFLAIDFDKSSWMDDVSAFLYACDSVGVPALLERSRSGNGGHVWIFFDRAIPAGQARKLGAALLTMCRERRYQLGFDSYDRMFPNQDTMPKGQFGNLIALPLQNKSVQQSNAVFVDRQFRAFDDQWSCLQAAQRMSSAQVDGVVKDAARDNAIIPVLRSFSDGEGEDDPWTLPPSGNREEKPLRGPLAAVAKITLSNMIYVEKEGFSASALGRVINVAAFQNPEFYKYQAMRMSTFGKPRVIDCSNDFPRHIGLPRGSLEKLIGLLESNGVPVEVEDERFAGTPIDLSFEGALRPLQQQAADELLKHDIGILSAATAFGKTVVAAHIIAERKVNTLVLVHRSQLLDQWIERLRSFLSVDPKSIGQLGGGKDKRRGIVDVATIQSLQRQGVVKDLVAEYGQIIVDECHHIPAFTFEQVIKQAKAKYVLGLTATPVREDGHHPIVIMQCGPIRFKVSNRDNKASNIQEHLIIPRRTAFELPCDSGDVAIQDIYSRLAADEERNALLFNDIVQALEDGRSPLVITQRTEHLEKLAEKLKGFARNIIVFRGGLGKKQRVALQEKLDAVPGHEERIILATGQFIGEGFDDSRLDTLFLTLPISGHVNLHQYAGRLHRQHEGKAVVRIYDYVDSSVPKLLKMYERRLKGYKSIGYQIAD
jgi:superfamily II DNA or RNA helicase